MASPVDVITALAVGIGEAVLKPLRPDPGPVTARWAVGVGEIAAGLPKLPAPMRRLARHLNRLGSVAVSPAGIEFDGNEVEWTRVTDIRTRRLVGYLFTDAVTQQLDRMPLWRFPGRAVVLSGITRTMLTAVVLATGLRLDRGVSTVYIPADVHYRGLIRAQQIAPGIPAALVLADPAVRDCVEATAESHGIAVRAADDDVLVTAVERAAAIRSAIAALARPVLGWVSQAGTRSSA